MNIDEVRKYCSEIAEEYGYSLDVPVEENKNIKSTLGRVKFRLENNKYIPTKIEFSKNLLSMERSIIIDTIKHEMAHYLVLKETGENHRHDKIWKKWAIRLGCRPRATIKAEGVYTSEEAYKYVVSCRKCGKVVGRYKRASKVIRNPSRYRSLCCNEKVKVSLL